MEKEHILTPASTKWNVRSVTTWFIAIVLFTFLICVYPFGVAVLAPVTIGIALFIGIIRGRYTFGCCRRLMIWIAFFWCCTAPFQIGALRIFVHFHEPGFILIPAISFFLLMLGILWGIATAEIFSGSSKRELLAGFLFLAPLFNPLWGVILPENFIDKVAFNALTFGRVGIEEIHDNALNTFAEHSQEIEILKKDLEKYGTCDHIRLPCYSDIPLAGEQSTTPVPKHLLQEYKIFQPNYVSIQMVNANEPYIFFNFACGFDTYAYGLIFGNNTLEMTDPTRTEKLYDGIFMFRDHSNYYEEEEQITTKPLSLTE